MFGLIPPFTMSAGSFVLDFIIHQSTSLSSRHVPCAASEAAIPPKLGPISKPSGYSDENALIPCSAVPLGL